MLIGASQQQQQQQQQQQRVLSHANNDLSVRVHIQLMLVSLMLVGSCCRMMCGCYELMSTVFTNMHQWNNMS